MNMYTKECYAPLSLSCSSLLASCNFLFKAETFLSNSCTLLVNSMHFTHLSSSSLQSLSSHNDMVPISKSDDSARLHGFFGGSNSTSGSCCEFFELQGCGGGVGASAGNGGSMLCSSAKYLAASFACSSSAFVFLSPLRHFCLFSSFFFFWFPFPDLILDP